MLVLSSDLGTLFGSTFSNEIKASSVCPSTAVGDCRKTFSRCYIAVLILCSINLIRRSFYIYHLCIVYRVRFEFDRALRGAFGREHALLFAYVLRLCAQSFRCEGSPLRVPVQIGEPRVCCAVSSNFVTSVMTNLTRPSTGTIHNHVVLSRQNSSSAKRRRQDKY